MKSNVNEFSQCMVNAVIKLQLLNPNTTVIKNEKN